MATPRLTRRAALQKAAAAAPLAIAPGALLGRRARADAAGSKRLTILHTNDTHSRMEPFASGSFKGMAGVARRATVINEARAANPATIVLDAGDTFQGTAWFNEFKGRVDVQVMNALGYHATAVGNHDFDAGVEQLAENLKEAPKMAALAANFSIDSGSPLHGRVEPRRIIEVGGVRVGVFGLGIAFEGLVNPKLHVGVSYDDPRDAAREQIALLREAGVDAVIAVSHLGYEMSGDEIDDRRWPADVPGVDYVVGGHTHTFLKEPTVIAHSSGWRTAVMQVGHSGLNVGRAELLIDRAGQATVAAAGPIGVGGPAIA